MSNVNNRLKENKNNYEEYKTYICNNIDCRNNIGVDKFIIYDYTATGSSVNLIKKILLDNKILDDNIEIINIPRTTIHTDAYTNDRCVDYNDIILNPNTNKSQTSKMCNFIITLMYNIVKNKLHL